MESDAKFRDRAGIIQQSCQQKIDPYVYVDSNSSGHARMFCETPVPVFSCFRNCENTKQ
jgi:hypothetical protein